MDGYFDSETGYMFVMKGSKVSVTYKRTKSLKGYMNLNKVMIDNGVVDYKEGEDYGTLRYNVAFTSASPASSIVIGMISNGRKEWVNREGTTFGDLSKI